MFLSSRTTGAATANTNPWDSKRALNAQLQDLMSLALASATQTTYSSGVKRFLNFCMLVYFAVTLSRSLTLPTIKVYLLAVGSFHCRQGFKDPTHHNPQLKMVFCGTQRANIDRRSHPRQPITRAILHRVLHQVQHSYKLPRQDKHMLTAAFCWLFSASCE